MTYQRYRGGKGSVGRRMLPAPWSQIHRFHKARSLIGMVISAGGGEILVVPPRALVLEDIILIERVHAHWKVPAPGMLPTIEALDAPVLLAPIVAVLLIIFEDLLQHFLLVESEATKCPKLLDGPESVHLDFMR